MENKDLNDYLKIFAITKKRYLVGIFQDGITLYKQQVRSLNILYALLVTNKIKPGDDIAIFGGGVAGLTLASAALKVGLNVTIFEQKPIYLHVQYACETRKIHPNIYDWPDKDSLFPYADLPVMSWRYDTASSVCRQLINGFKKTVQESETKIREEKNYKLVSVSEEDNKVVIDFTNNGNHTVKFDILIYATGFGIEQGVELEKYTPSYWRNDDYSQMRLTKDVQEYIISGTGDGGFIDLFRLKIFGFSLDSLIRDLRSNQDSYNKLTPALEYIKDNWDETHPKTWLFEEFQKIDSAGLLHYFKEILKNKERKENIVRINGNAKDFKSVLNLNNKSLQNNLIAFCLYRNGAFTYVKGKCQLVDNEYQLDGAEISPSEIVIIRHGTQRESLLNKLIERRQIQNLKTKQVNNYYHNTVKRYWPTGWWSSQFFQNSLKDYHPLIEFFTPETQSTCSGFVSVLSKILEHFHLKHSQEGKDFRVTLHRIIYSQGSYYFQQVTPYFGNKKNIVGEVGRVFPISGGAAGYSARTGRAVIMEKKPGGDFKLLSEKLGLSTLRARSLDEGVSSLFTMPIFARAPNKKLATNLILYIDSNKDDFFEKDDDILPLISKATIGFIESISSQIGNNQISMAANAFEPLEIKDEPKLQSELKLSGIVGFKDVSERDDFNPDVSKLIFDSFHSFNIIYDYENDPFQQY